MLLWVEKGCDGDKMPSVILSLSPLLGSWTYLLQYRSVTFFFCTKSLNLHNFITFRCTLLTFITHPSLIPSLLETIWRSICYVCVCTSQIARKKRPRGALSISTRHLFCGQNLDFKGGHASKLNAHPRLRSNTWPSVLFYYKSAHKHDGEVFCV
jgi:hypothetical protein